MPDDQRVKPLTAALRASYEAATANYASQLQSDDEGMTYLQDERGLDWPTIARMRLGIVRQPLDESHRRFSGRIHIPNMGASHDNHVVGSKYRLIKDDGEKRKYDGPFGQMARLYNLAALKYAESEIYVTEGEFDAICIEDLGLPAVAVPGANMMGASHRYRERIFDGLDVILCRDEGEAGDKLVAAMHEYTTRVVSFGPDHGDVNEFYLAKGPAALEARLKGTDHG